MKLYTHVIKELVEGANPRELGIENARDIIKTAIDLSESTGIDLSTIAKIIDSYALKSSLLGSPATPNMEYLSTYDPGFPKELFAIADILNSKLRELGFSILTFNNMVAIHTPEKTLCVLQVARITKGEQPE